MKLRVTAMLAALLLASCGKPQTVADFKAALERLSMAGEQDQLAGYPALLSDVQAKFELAKKDLRGESAAAAADALAKAADAGAVWRGTEVIDGGLSPDTEAPLKRLGVVKDDADFRKHSDLFIAFEDNPDDDTPTDTQEKTGARDAARKDLMRQSLDVADKALVKVEATL